MNIYLLQFVGKWISVLIISILSLFIKDFTVEKVTMDNINSSKDQSVQSVVIPFETDYQYTASLPQGVENVLQEGIDGVIYSLDNKEVVVQEMVPSVIEVGTGPQETYQGMLTGYGPDCAGCSLVGNVSCKTREGVKHSLINNGIYYDDYKYGKVRIVSADNRLFPCGTILEIHNNKLDTLAIVLDTGAGMRNAYDNGQILIDLAFETEALTGGITNRNTTFKVKRYGW